MVAPALPRVPAVSLAANRKRRQRPSSKTPNKDQNQNLPPNPALGFGIKKKNPVWQCVQNCGACCKLDKGFAFPYPEEIFEDPSDIEVRSLSATFLLQQCVYFCGFMRIWETIAAHTCWSVPVI